MDQSVMIRGQDFDVFVHAKGDGQECDKLFVTVYTKRDLDSWSENEPITADQLAAMLRLATLPEEGPSQVSRAAIIMRLRALREVGRATVNLAQVCMALGLTHAETRVVLGEDITQSV